MGKGFSAKSNAPGGDPSKDPDGGDGPEVIPIDPAVWRLRDAQRKIEEKWNDTVGDRQYVEAQKVTIERALFKGDVSAMGQLASGKDRKVFLDLPDALRGDPVALASIAEAFASIGCHDYASAFSELAGNGAWPWSAAYRCNLDEKRSAAILKRLRTIIPPAGSDT